MPQLQSAGTATWQFYELAANPHYKHSQSKTVRYTENRIELSDSSNKITNAF